MNRDFSKEGIQMHEKLLNITHHQGNANQNQDEISPHIILEWLKLTTQETTGVGEDAEKGEPSCTKGKLVQPLW